MYEVVQIAFFEIVDFRGHQVEQLTDESLNTAGCTAEDIEVQMSLIAHRETFV